MSVTVIISGSGVSEDEAAEDEAAGEAEAPEPVSSGAELPQPAASMEKASSRQVRSSPDIRHACNAGHLRYIRRKERRGAMRFAGLVILFKSISPFAIKTAHEMKGMQQ
jgi:hypothetical protein